MNVWVVIGNAALLTESIPLLGLILPPTSLISTIFACEAPAKHDIVANFATNAVKKDPNI